MRKAFVKAEFKPTAALYKACLVECCAIAKVEPAMIFARNHRGRMHNNPHYIAKRREVWSLMRAWRDPTSGLGLSYPEIAAACGCPNHSTVMTGVKRMARERATSVV